MAGRPSRRVLILFFFAQSLLFIGCSKFEHATCSVDVQNIPKLYHRSLQEKGYFLQQNGDLVPHLETSRRWSDYREIRYKTSTGWHRRQKPHRLHCEAHIQLLENQEVIFQSFNEKTYAARYNGPRETVASQKCHEYFVETERKYIKRIPECVLTPDARRVSNSIGGEDFDG